MYMKTMKALALCTALLTGAMTVPAVPVTVFAEETAPTSGSCGDNCTWSFDAESGTLTISGEGEAWDGSGWENFYQDIQSVNLEEGITTLGTNLFRNCTALAKVDFPKTLEEVGELAFAGTPWLDAMRKENPLVIVNHLLIDAGAALSEKEVVIPADVTKVMDAAFYPFVVANGSEGYVESQIEKITVLNPDCELTFMMFYSWGNPPFDEFVKEELKQQGDDALMFCGYDGSTVQVLAENIGYRFESLGEAPAKEEIAASGSCGENCTWSFDAESGTLTISGTGEMDNVIMFFDEPWYHQQGEIQKIILDEGIETIGKNAFHSCSKVTDIVFPESLSKIDSQAFYGCSGLKSVTLSDNVSEIGEAAFYNCTQLSDVTICNPNCSIFDSSSTFATLLTTAGNEFSGIIRGYDNSTAEAYAKKYGYTFESLGKAPASSALKTGDLDGDGEIGVADAQFTLTAYVKGMTGGDTGLTAEQTAAADVDKDGEITITDAQLILNYYVQNTILGTETGWDQLIK